MSLFSFLSDILIVGVLSRLGFAILQLYSYQYEFRSIFKSKLCELENEKINDISLCNLML